MGFSSFLVKLLLLLLSLAPLSSPLNSDGLALLTLKAAITFDPHGALHTWLESDTTPCKWLGVTCTRRRATELILSRCGLTGYIPSELGAVSELRQLSLDFNNFSNPIPFRIFNSTSLLHVDLSHNSLSGQLPPQIKNLINLTHLDLSSNRITGPLPDSLPELRTLSGTLNLSCNQFSGRIPTTYGYFPETVSLDFRQNNLSGEIPRLGSLLNQGPTAFIGNPGLCGLPLQTPCPNVQNPIIVAGYPKLPRTTEARRGPGGPAVAVILIFGVAALAAVLVFAWLARKKGSIRVLKSYTSKGEVKYEVETQDGKFGVMDEGFNLELEDLLRASAYVIGKSGRNGILYKVVAPPQTVVVRRLCEPEGSWRFKEFESEVNAIERVRHPNIVPLRAYYYARNQKLLISDFFPNGSLFTALHGGDCASLTWVVRFGIARGVARGLAHIHECSPRKHVHGNLKSTKILLGKNYEAHIAGFGLARLNSTGQTQAQSQSEAQTSSVLTKPSSMRFSGPKCDVYSFGIILLEILTGRLPEEIESVVVGREFEDEDSACELIDSAIMREVQKKNCSASEITHFDLKQQVVAAFRIALSCIELDPELRPRMRSVSEKLDAFGIQL